MIETKIYVGLNDADTLEQKHDTMKYVSVLRNCAVDITFPFPSIWLRADTCTMMEDILRKKRW